MDKSEQQIIADRLNSAMMDLNEAADEIRKKLVPILAGLADSLDASLDAVQEAVEFINYR